MTPNEIAAQIVDASYHIHRALGPGLLESVYEIVLDGELRRRGLHVDRECPIPLSFNGMEFPVAFRADLIVADTVIVEVKSVATLAPVHKMQVLTYLRLTNKQLGLLINFNVPLIKEGIHRIVNGLPE